MIMCNFKELHNREKKIKAVTFLQLFASEINRQKYTIS